MTVEQAFLAGLEIVYTISLIYIAMGITVAFAVWASIQLHGRRYFDALPPDLDYVKIILWQWLVIIAAIIKERW